MQINLKATKIDLTPELKEYIQTKMDMLEKYLGSIPVIHCDMEVGLAVNGQKSGEIYHAQVNLELPREMLRVEKVESDIIKAVENVKEHLAESIKKYKEKMIDRRRKVE